MEICAGMADEWQGGTFAKACGMKGFVLDLAEVRSQ